MKEALGHVFPDAQQQLCIHHINSNVMLQSKRRRVSSSTHSGTGEESSPDEPEAVLTQNDRQAVRAHEQGDRSIKQKYASEPISHDYHGVLRLWKRVTFAETEEDHQKAWGVDLKTKGLFSTPGV